MLFFLIYKSCSLLNHAWDSHTIGQFLHLAQKLKKSNNTAAFLTTVPCRMKKCLTIYSILNNDNIIIFIFILWDSENAMSRQQPMYIFVKVISPVCISNVTLI